MLPVKLFNFLQCVIFDIFERITTNDNWVISQRNRIDFFFIEWNPANGITPIKCSITVH